MLADYPLGKKPLSRSEVRPHAPQERTLSQDDLTDLALLRLDCMAAIGIGENGLPEDFHFAHIKPLNAAGSVFNVEPPVNFHDFSLDMAEFVKSLEIEIGRAATRNVSDKRERAILVSVSTKPKDEQIASLEELKCLAETSDVVVLDVAWQRPKKLNPRYLVGEGKLKEIVINALQKEATLLIFDQNLSPGQIREIGEVTELKVIDRTQLILDIFARRAHSRDGKVQVELAQLRYILTKLTGKGTSSLASPEE